jgi:hypothetical protein
MHRREFLALSAGLLAVRPALPLPAAAEAEGPPAHDALDDTLEKLHATDAGLGGHRANHGPMCVEALETMGRGDAIGRWSRRYDRFVRKPVGLPETRITETDWRSALGASGRFLEWRGFFERGLAGRPWREFLAIWFDRLAPGAVSVATHGLLRSAHAARGLARKDTPPRRRELACAFAYWAAHYKALPEGAAPGRGGRGLGLRESYGAIPRLPEDLRPKDANIMGRLVPVERFEAFAPVADLPDLSGDPARVLSALTEIQATIFTANVPRVGHDLAFLHAVTAPSAVRLLLPYLDDERKRRLLRYGWQACAALWSAHADESMKLEIETAPMKPEEIVDRAVEHGDEHVLKLSEVALREHAAHPRDIYLAAARLAGERLSR